jgi:hypothetical protein
MPSILGADIGPDNHYCVYVAPAVSRVTSQVTLLIVTIAEKGYGNSGV